MISQKAVDEYVPLSRASDGTITTQFTMTTLEELGLLKMDFLGLRTLTVIQNAVQLVEKTCHADISNCDHAIRLITTTRRCWTRLEPVKREGVFQLESAGMKNFMKELKPQSLEDIIAGISLYRPGPMDFIPQYIRGKNDPETHHVRLPAAGTDPGADIWLYRLPGAGHADRAGSGRLYTGTKRSGAPCHVQEKSGMSWQKERQNFVYGNEEEGVPGCIANGIDEKTANKIYDEMMDFAKYAFNKSHAAAYAVVAYQTAYLKYYYPVEFMAALMTSVIDNSAKGGGVYP